eukprot:TRINITY_DN9836_c0_g1_i1.p1 TRINITY_DN9836_c0_g1~~TRINITY_DN9836_c0_g1_i1.p1  ORF type:complete len:152 (-),score=33.95 TRINITY_DN9836_c0_g1_i1:56-511(-)
MALTPFTNEFLKDLWNDSLSPFHPQFVDRFWNQQLSSFQTGKFTPSIDVKETEKEIVVHAELAGIPKENIKLDFHDGVLEISGEKEERKEEKGETWHRTERSTGKFSRKILVPKGCTTDSISATHKDGVLEVTIAKPSVPESPKPKRINIQ